MSDVVRAFPDASSPVAARLIAAAAQAEARGRLALGGAVTDLFVPVTGRLSDYQRATMTRLLDGLIESIERPLRDRIAAALPDDTPARAALETAPGGMARLPLDAAGVLRDPALVALLLRHADGHRVGAARRIAAAHDAAPMPIATLAQDADPTIATAAGALAAAQALRIDRFRDPSILLVDLPAELAHRLVWLVSAALRLRLIGLHALDPGLADAAIAPAAGALLAMHDPAAGVDALAMALAHALVQAGRLDEAALAGFAAMGDLAALVAGLATRAQVTPAAAWDMVLAPGGDRLALLLRAADVARHRGGEILLCLTPDAPDRVVAHLSGWEALTPEAARAALRLWRLDGAYRDAILALGDDPGGAG